MLKRNNMHLQKSIFVIKQYDKTSFMESSKFRSKDYLDIDSILQAKKISKTELANMLGVPRQSVYSYLDGNVSLEKMVNIANALEVPVWQLFSGSENSINGFIEYNGTTHLIQSVQDLEILLEEIHNKP
ncbi:MAG: helix-turn-helix transcriptional regulator [Prolixibacteraceae bacterium]